MATKLNKSQKIRDYLAKGMDPAKIAEKVGVSVNYVYNIRWNDQKKAEKAGKAGKQAKAGKRGRPRKAKEVEAAPVKEETLDVLPTLAEVMQEIESSQDALLASPVETLGGISTLDFIDVKGFSFNVGNAIYNIAVADYYPDTLERLQRAKTFIDREIATLRRDESRG